MHAISSLPALPSCKATNPQSNHINRLHVCPRSRPSRKYTRCKVRAQEGDRGPQLEDKEPKDKPKVEGQTTAIITGAISIIIGVLYLGLVQFMNVRGGELLPPPPEAYDHAFD